MDQPIAQASLAKTSVYRRYHPRSHAVQLTAPTPCLADHNVVTPRATSAQHVGFGANGRSRRVNTFACRTRELGPGRHLAELRGALDYQSAQDVQRRLEPLWASGTLVLLDLSGVTFADSSCIRALLLARRDADRHGATLACWHRRPGCTPGWRWAECSTCSESAPTWPPRSPRPRPTPKAPGQLTRFPHDGVELGAVRTARKGPTRSARASVAGGGAVARSASAPPGL